MPPKCYICNFYDPKRMSLYRIPDRNDEYSDRSYLWLKLLNEKAENKDRIRICSDHFPKKKPAKSADYLDVDWIPNQNLGRFAKNQSQSIIISKRRKVLRRYEFLKTKKSVAKMSKSVRGLLPEDKISKESESQSNCKNGVCTVDDSNLVDTNVTQINNACGREPAATDEKVSSSKEVYLYTKNLAIPLKKKRIYIEKLDETIYLPKEIQTELSVKDVEMLFNYLRESEEERNELLIKISNLKIDVDFLKGNDKKTRFYTGLTTWSLFEDLFAMIELYLPTHFNCKLSKFQMVVLTLMKLRLNSSFTDLAYRFQIAVVTASRYFHRCIFILFKLFSGSKLLYWPTDRQNLLMNTPKYFASLFKERITVIVDCFEIFIETPSVLLASAQGFSTYKHHITLKYLIGISVTIIFISCGYGGRASDKFVSMDSGFINLIEEGDFVLADKGFLIEEEVKAARDAHLRMPCFVRNQNQLNPYQIEQSRQYSSVRIHVERMLLRPNKNVDCGQAE